MTSPRDPQAVVAAIAAAEDDHGRHVNAVVRQYFDDDRPTDRADRLLTIAADYRGELEVARARIAELEAAAARVAQLEERIGVLEQRPAPTASPPPGEPLDAEREDALADLSAQIGELTSKLEDTHKKLRRLESRPALTHNDLGNAVVAAGLSATEDQCKKMLECLRSLGPARIDAKYHPAPDVVEVDLDGLRMAYAVGWTDSQQDLPLKDVDTHEPASWRAAICYLAENYPNARVSQLRVTPRAPKEG